MDEDLLVSQMADKILFALESDIESMYQASYDLAKHYLKPEMLEAWRKALDAHTITVLKKLYIGKL